MVGNIVTMNELRSPEICDNGCSGGDNTFDPHAEPPYCDARVPEKNSGNRVGY